MSLFNRRPKGGVRLVHQMLRSCVFTVESPLRAYSNPVACGVCGYTHKVKTYHLYLDAQGATIVSPQILDRLKEIPSVIGGELTVSNAVKQPPEQRVGFGGPDTYRIERFNFDAPKEKRSSIG